MKIKHKRSNDLVDGKAKKPTTEQLDIGELAVNYNADDVTLFLKDDNNVIRSFNGNNADGSVSLDGDVHIKGRLSVDESVEIGPFDFSANLASGVTLSKNGTVYVQNSTAANQGDATCFQALYGTSEVINFKSDGSADFGSTVKTEGTNSYFTVNRTGSQSDTAALYLGFADSVQKFKVGIDGTTIINNDVRGLNVNGIVLDQTGHITARRFGDSENYLFSGYMTQDADNPTSTIASNGSASFVNTVKSQGGVAAYNAFSAGYGSTADTFAVRGNGTIIGHESGGATTGNYKYKIDSNGSATFASGKINLTTLGQITAVGNDAYVHIGLDKNAGKVPFNIYDTAGGNETIAKVDGDGSATFARQVVSTRYSQDSGLSINYNGTDYGYALYDQTQLYAGIGVDGSATFAGGIETVSKITTGALEVKPYTSSPGSFLMYGYNSSSHTISLNQDGTATFAGPVYVGPNYTGTNVSSTQGAAVNDGYFSCTNSDASYSILEGYLINNSTPTVHIKASGSATFAQTVTVSDSSGTNFLSKAGGMANPSNFRFYAGEYSGSETSRINADGSAAFAGRVDVASNGLARTGIRVNDFGVLQIRKDGATSRALEIYQDGNVESVIHASISNDGSSEFSGKQKVEVSGDYAHIARVNSGSDKSCVYAQHMDSGNVFEGASGSGITSYIKNDGSAYFISGVRVANAPENTAALSVKSNGSNNNYLGYAPNSEVRAIINCDNDGGKVYLRNSASADSITLLGDSGNATFTGQVDALNVNSTSDIALKKDITPIEGAVSKLSSINGVGFAWKETGDRTYGVIAQEVEKEFPELVQTKDFKSVNYNGLVGVLIEAVKELEGKIGELNAEIAELKKS